VEACWCWTASALTWAVVVILMTGSLPGCLIPPKACTSALTTVLLHQLVNRLDVGPCNNSKRA
jgi:hypothetical protein